MSARRVNPVYPEQERRELNRRGFALPLVIILILLPIVTILAWAPWVTQENAEVMVNNKIKRECSINAGIDKNTQDFKKTLFGAQYSLNYYCKGNTINASYFISSFNNLNLKSSKTIKEPIRDTQVNTDETSGWKTYTNKDIGFLVKYPDKVVLSEVINKENTVISFDNYNELGIQSVGSRPGNEFENISINIGISIETVQKNTSLEQYLDQKYPDRDGNAAEYGTPSFQNQKKEMKSILIGGENGLFKENGMAFETISRKAWVKKGNKVFTFSASGSGETGTYVSDIAAKTFDQILSTFRFE